MKRDNRGFSLIELMVTLAIFAVASTALFSLVNSATTQYQRANMEVSLQYEAQTVMNQVADLLIDASKGIRYNYVSVGAGSSILSDAEITGTPVVKLIFIYDTDKKYLLKWEASTKKIFYNEYVKDATNTWTIVAADALMADYVEDISLDLTNADKTSNQSGVIRLKIKFKYNKEYELNQNINLRNTIMINEADETVIYP